MMDQINQSQQSIIFFDGVCGLCNFYVDWILKRDRERFFMFAPLQGEKALEMLGPQKNDPEEWSLIVWNEGQWTKQSDAVFVILKNLGGFWKMVSWLKFIPRCIRDFFYRIIAKYRYQWFGKKSECRIPTAEERKRFYN